MPLETHPNLCEFNEVTILEEIAVNGRQCQSGLPLKAIQIGICNRAWYRSPSYPVVRGKNGVIPHRLWQLARPAHKVDTPQLPESGINVVGDNRAGHTESATRCCRCESYS